MKKLEEQEQYPEKFVSPVGWYVAWELLRFEWDDEDITNPNRRCLSWENQILIRAETPDEAYEKALSHGQLSEGEEMWKTDDETQKGRWRFEGLTGLCAIYEEPADGAEIAWHQQENRSVRKIKEKVRSKDELEVFQR